MDPVQSWLDADEVRRMAESLMAPPPQVDPLVLDAGYGEGFEGFASGGTAPIPAAPPIAQAPVSPTPPKKPDVDTRRVVIGNTLADARRVAEGSGMLQAAASPPPPVSPVPVPPAAEETPSPVFNQPAPHTVRAPFLARLQHFSATLRRELAAQAMFLIDNEGQILLDEVENPKLIQVARTLANASYTASRQTAGSAAVGNLHVKIGASITLEVVPLRSRYGLLILGVIFPAPLGAERVQQVAELLYNTVEPVQEGA